MVCIVKRPVTPTCGARAGTPLGDPICRVKPPVTPPPPPCGAWVQAPPWATRSRWERWERRCPAGEPSLTRLPPSLLAAPASIGRAITPLLDDDDCICCCIPALHHASAPAHVSLPCPPHPIPEWAGLQASQSLDPGLPASHPHQTHQLSHPCLPALVLRASGGGEGWAHALAIGSVKSCYGHTEGAAGLTGALLALQAMHNQVGGLLALQAVATKSAGCSS